jgi:hypothetical protein
MDTTFTVKINTGNFETIDASKTIRKKITYETEEELAKKSAAIDAVLIKFVKAEAETALRETGRRRVIKPNPQEKEGSIWNGPPATSTM